MFFSGLHQFQSLSDLFSEFLGQIKELLFGVIVRFSPIVTFLSIEKWIIYVLHHIVEHSNGVGSEFSEKDFLVAAFVDIDLDYKEVVPFSCFQGGFS